MEIYFDYINNIVIFFFFEKNFSLNDFLYFWLRVENLSNMECKHCEPYFNKLTNFFFNLPNCPNLFIYKFIKFQDHSYLYNFICIVIEYK